MSDVAHTRPAPATGFVATLEQRLATYLRYGPFWVIVVCGLYVSLTLSLLLARHPDAFKEHPLAPVARVLLVVECALFVTALLMAQMAGRPASAEASGAAPSRLAAALAGGVMLLLQFTLQISPLLMMYRSPELAKQGIAVPLMLLQRGMLVCLCILAAYNVMLALRLTLRLPTLVAGAATLLLYLWGTHALIVRSYNHGNAEATAYTQLNDVFYWNQLSQHISSLPKLYTERVVGRIDPEHFSFYLRGGLGLCVVSLLLWLPAAIRLDSRETQRVKRSKPEST